MGISLGYSRDLYRDAIGINHDKTIQNLDLLSSCCFSAPVVNPPFWESTQVIVLVPCFVGGS
jgi:hypothetical protein